VLLYPGKEQVPGARFGVLGAGSSPYPKTMVSREIAAKMNPSDTEFDLKMRKESLV